MASLWDAIDDELYRLPPELKDPRFDSLRHVLNIVSSVNAESSVAEVGHNVFMDTMLGFRWISCPSHLLCLMMVLHENYKEN